MSIPLKKTLLIVCEGESTEPNYFYDLQKLIDKKNIDYRINILPKPPLKKKDEEEKAKAEAIESGRPKRQLKTVSDEHLLPEIIPEDFQGQPTRYVWFALEGLDTHDEVWSVYDKDGHPHHEQALNLAEQKALEGKKVNIAFSSIAFELWYLLHFEKEPPYPFVKAQCRTGTKPDNCGKGIEKDCNGKMCIAGYVKSKGYMDPNDNVKGFRFSTIADNTEFAIENAINLRKSISNPTIPIYELNPFTNVDKLIFKLLNLEYDYKWIDSEKAKNQSISFEISSKDGNCSLSITNISKATVICLSSRFKLVNVKGECLEVLERFVLGPEEAKPFILKMSDYSDFKPVYYSIVLDDGTNGIFEIN